VLFVKSLTGQLPQIRLEATASGTPAAFTFQLQNELQLLDDLEITGNGTQDFVISGNIRDFYVPTAPASVVPLITLPHNVRKTGTSRVTLSGNNSFGGTLTIEGGEVALSGAAAAIDGAAGILIQGGGKLALHSGTIRVPALATASGGSFQFDGGLLKVINVTGNLVNSGGTFSPGMSTALSTISQNFIQNSGVLQIELGGSSPGTGFDKLQIDGLAAVSGGLQVLLTNGFAPALSQSFEILTADDGISGMFSQHTLPALPGGLSWQVLYKTNSVTLSVGPVGKPLLISPVGDYNRNGVVDAADYSVWRNSLGSTTSLAADGNGDNIVNQSDYAVWKNRLGLTGVGGVAQLAGDYNQDGTVDAADYTLWRNTLGSTTLLGADGNGNRVVDLADYVLWKTNFGAGAGGGAAASAAPEPSGLLVIVIGVFAGSMVREFFHR